jgi:hypothetical protein
MVEVVTKLAYTSSRKDTKDVPLMFSEFWVKLVKEGGSNNKRLA